jgi:hypothetical protein
MVSADTSTGVPHYSQSIKTFLCLCSWGDASIESAENVSGDYEMKLSRISEIDVEQKQFLGCGTYRIVVYGKFR